MKIDVIGSGAIFTKYNSASYLIDDKILLDVPNGTCKKLMSMKKDVHKIRNVIITHFHADHYFDFPFLYLNQMSDCSHIEGKKSNLGIDNLQELLNKNSNLKIFTSILANSMYCFEIVQWKDPNKRKFAYERYNMLKWIRQNKFKIIDEFEREKENETTISNINISI